MLNSYTQPSHLKPPVRPGGMLAQAPAAQAGAVVHRTRAAPAVVNPIITPGSPIVVVKKSHTAPTRVPITLKTSALFRRSGILTRTVTPTSGNIRLFTATTGGTEITYNGTDNVFTATQLSSQRGVRLFAQADSPSSNLNDFQLTLILTPGPTPVGPPATATMTAVLLMLDISAPRTAPGAPLTSLPQPPATPPAPGIVATDKWFGGIQLNAQNPGNNQPRAQLLVGQVIPAAFNGDLVIRQVRITGNNITGLDNKAQIFDGELPGPRQTPPITETPKSNPFEFNANTITSLAGREFFIQGRNTSVALRDTGFQLGIKDVEVDGDRVAVTVAVAPVITLDSPIVVVRKSHTNPARRMITLQASAAFGRSGTLTRSPGGPPIRLFDRARGGNEIDVTLAGHTFTGAELSASVGIQLFAESIVPSGAADDYQLTLTLTPGTTPVGAPQTVRMTAVELTLDVGLSRPSPGVAPPVMSANDKINTGRFVQLPDPGFSHERAMIMLRPPNPPIPLMVELAALNAQVQAFGIEAPAAGQASHPNPVTFPSALLTVVPGGMQLFAEGIAVGTAARNTGFRYGIQGLENEADRIMMTTVQFDIAENDVGATPALTAVRFGLWDNAYDASENVRNDFIDNDRRRFHFRVIDASTSGPTQILWKTVAANGTTNIDEPASQILTLPAVVGSPGRFVSRGVLLVSDDTDAAQTTASGLNPALVPEPRTRGASDHRLRRATIDGFVHALYQAAPGQLLRLRLPIFDRAVPFTTTSASNVATGSQVVTPAAMSGTATTGALWSITVGKQLTIDTGANQEEVTVTAVTLATFTARFSNAHNGTGAPFQIAGRTDERRRVSIRIMRYTNPGSPAFPLATATNIAAELSQANQRWNQVGLQIDSQNVGDRPIPPAALDGAGIYGGSANNAFEQAALSDLIPVTPDNTLTAVFVPLGAASAYATIGPRIPILQPGGTSLTLGDRYFIFINPGLNPEIHALAHELYHALFNRFDVAVPRRFFTFNTNPATAHGILLPDVRVNRRIQNFHTPDPNIDPSNNNVINWARRIRTSRLPVAGNINPSATTTTGNKLTTDF